MGPSPILKKGCESPGIWRRRSRAEFGLVLQFTLEVQNKYGSIRSATVYQKGYCDMENPDCDIYCDTPGKRKMNI